MVRSLALWSMASAILIVIVNGRSATAAEPSTVLAGKGLQRAGSVFALKSEDDVFKAVAAVEAKLKDYRSEKNASRTEAEKKALAAELTVQRDALRQQMNQAVPQIRAQIQALTMQQAALNQQQASGGRLGNNVRGSFPLSNAQTAYQMNALAQQIAQLQMQGEQITAGFNELNNQINELTPKKKADKAKAKAGEKPSASPVDDKPSASTVEEKLKALQDSIAEARKVVEATQKEYATLAADSQVTSALEALNRTVSLKQTLGPSRKMLESIKALDRAEAYAANGDDPSGSTKSTASHKRKSRSAKKK